MGSLTKVQPFFNTVKLTAEDALFVGVDEAHIRWYIYEQEKHEPDEMTN